jgi:acyl dehydratase
LAKRFIAGAEPLARRNSVYTVRVETTFRELRPTSKDTRKILALEQIAFNQRDEKVLENTQLVLFEKP